MIKWRIKHEQMNLMEKSTCFDLKSCRALKTLARAKWRNSTTDILSLLGHSYLYFQILKASYKFQ